MPDLTTELTRRLQAALAVAAGSEWADADPVLRASEHADFQANAAMALAKRLRRAPRDLAGAIVAALDRDGLHVSVAGPGFVNLDVDDALLSSFALAAARDERSGVAPVALRQRVIVDYSGPNVAKEMHVGHLRSTIIGDAIARTLRFLGHEVILQNHVGDWGTQFGMLIEHSLDQDADLDGVDVGGLTELYRAAQARFGDDDVFAARARERVVALQSGDATSRATWKQLVSASERHFDAVYRTLGVLLAPDDTRGESTYNEMLDATVAELVRDSLVVEDQGALVALLDAEACGREEAPLIVRKRDGGYGYAATDLAAIRYRVQQLRADRLVYVVDARQQRHFAQVFEVARRAGWLDGVDAEHVAFGAVLGADGKPLKTRAGDLVALDTLLDEAVARARAVVEEKSPTLPRAEREAIAQTVGIGALKYADLSHDRVKDYLFDWDRMLALDGNTAPYLQYAYARIASVFRRGGADLHARPDVLAVATPEEHRLALALVATPEVLRTVEATLQPHRLCGHLYDVATRFTAFYEACPILVDDARLRASRLALSALTARTLRTGLDLLGIGVSDRM